MPEENERGLVSSLLQAAFKRLAASLLILFSIVVLTQVGLYLAEQGRKGLPVTPVSALTQTLQQTADYFFHHPETYVWHKVVQPWHSVVLDLFQKSAGLLLISLTAACLFGVSLGISAALLRRGGAAPLMILVSIIGISTPSFLLGMLFWIANIGVMRFTGGKPLPPTGFGWDLHLVMPCLVLAMRPFAQIMQVTYVSMSDAMEQEYIRAARARGAPARLVIYGHALRNIWIPILTTTGASLRFSLASLPVVESFFLWPGIGLALLQAISFKMPTLVTDLVAALGILFLLLNLLLDVVYPVLDPRLRRDAQTVEEGEARSLRQRWLDFQQVLRQWLARRKPVPAPAGQPGRLAQPHAIHDEGTPYHISTWSILASGLKNLPLMAGSLLVLALVGLAFWGPNLTAASPYETHGVMTIAGEIQAPPFQTSEVFPWGSDPIGRDLRALVLAGARQTLTLVTFAMIARLALGVLLGMLAGWRQNSWVDRTVQSLISIWAAFPVTVFAMILILGMGIQKGMSVFVIALCVVGWGETAQYVRSQVISQKPQLYIEAAHSVGARPWEILLRHILPHLLPSIIVMAALEMGGILMLLAELGFLNIFLGGGFKVEIGETGRMVPVVYYYSDVPEWGALLANIRNWWRSYPWLAWYPGLFFFLSVLGFNLLGEGLRRFLQESRINLSRFINRYSLVGILVALTAVGFAIRSNAPLQKYRGQALEFNTANAMRHIQVLTSPEMRGRESGTDDARRAAEYIGAQMEEIGLLPATTEGNYLFPYKSTYFHIIQTPALSLEGESAQPQYMRDFKEFVTDIESTGEVEAQVVGVAINPGAYSAEVPRVPVKGNDLRDKILLVRKADFEHITPGTMAGMLVVNDADNLPQQRLLPNYSSYTLFGNPDGRPVLLITPQLAERILAASGSSLADLEAQARLQPLNKFYQTSPGMRLNMSVLGNETDLEETHYNVIGVLPGSGSNIRSKSGASLDSQLIVVSAYLDGLGVDSRGVVYPGANDNASGVAAMLELARTLQAGEHEPRRTIIFIAWAPGERGKGFGVNDILNATGRLGMLNLEAVVELSGLGAGSGEGISLGQGTSYRLVSLIQDAAGRLDVPVTTRGRGPHFDMNIGMGLGGRSALSAFLSWDGSDQSAHLPEDTLESIDPQKMEKSGRLTTLLLTLISREIEY